jgi:hypothetical protein
MTHYLLSVHSVEGEAREPMTDEETAHSHKQLAVLEQEMKTAGAWIVSGRLHEPGTATVVRMAGGEVVTTDGPFVESKEHLGGFDRPQPRPRPPAPARWPVDQTGSKLVSRDRGDDGATSRARQAQDQGAAPDGTGP